MNIEQEKLQMMQGCFECIHKGRMDIKINEEELWRLDNALIQCKGGAQEYTAKLGTDCPHFQLDKEQLKLI